jgi:hypothetical protein
MNLLLTVVDVVRFVLVVVFPNIVAPPLEPKITQQLDETILLTAMNLLLTVVDVVRFVLVVVFPNLVPSSLESKITQQLDESNPICSNKLTARSFSACILTVSSLSCIN